MKALMFYLIYKITNTISGKEYIGTHKTNNKNDSYMGSGKYLNYAIKKYGIENFTKEILYEYNNSEEMFAKEAEIVNEDYIATANTYNLKVGGFGGFDYINSSGRHLYGKNGVGSCGTQNLKDGRYWTDYRIRNGLQEDYCKKLSASIKTSYSNGRVSTFVELNKDPDNIKKRKESFVKIKHQQGENNSQFGKMWITNDLENKTIRKTDFIPIGWRKGRVLK